MYFEGKVNARSRASMVAFLMNHRRYDTMSSNNGATSYAHCVKVNSLGLSGAQLDDAYELIDAEDYWDSINEPIREFTQRMGGSYTIERNGRSGGYLVLYESRYESTGHKSRCRSCGQHSFKYAHIPAGGNEGVIMAEVLRNEGSWMATDYLIQDAIKNLPLSIEEKMVLINKAKISAKDTTLGNKCGRCHTEGEFGRVNYTTPPKQLAVYPGRSIDRFESFSDKDEWTMDALRRRVKLVQAFDRACDQIRDNFISMLDNCEVVEEVVMVPQKRKVIQCLGA